MGASALTNLIPTTTGSASAIALIYPEITGRLSYQWGGLPLCLATAGVMAFASWLAARRLR